MKTSYFNNIPFIDTDIYMPISISLYSPDWYTGLSFPQLAPTPNILNQYKRKKLSVEQYIEDYNRQVLSKYNARLIHRRLCTMAGKFEPVLLCYELPKQFCHRHLVADWLTANIPELTVVEL